MKRNSGMNLYILIVVIVLMHIYSLNSVNAQSTSVSAAGSDNIRAGDTLVVTYRISNAASASYISIDLSFDTNKITFSKATPLISQWSLLNPNEISKGKIRIAVSDEDQRNPITGNSDFLRVEFNVRSGLSSGETVLISASDILVSSFNETLYPANVSFSRSILPPLSSDNSLSSMTVRNAQISPAFSNSVSNYTATVPFSVNSLTVNAIPRDSKAGVSISGNNLVVGSNSVVVTVTAENGSQRRFTINVTREQDPDYIPSNNADLNSLIPNPGILSPAFDPDITLYYVYLPYQIEKFDVDAQMEDIKSIGFEKSEIALVVGENNYLIKTFAEDGAEKEYKIVIIRMPENNDLTFLFSSEEITPKEDSPSSDSLSLDEGMQSEENQESKILENNSNGKSFWEANVPLWVVVIIVIVTGGFAVFIVARRQA